MTSEAGVIVQVPRGGSVDRNLRANPPPSIAGGRAILEHITGEAAGGLGPPEAGEVVMSVLSPEALTREPEQVRHVIRRAPAGDRPLVIIVQAAEELREDELAVVLDAADRARRRIIVRVMADA